MRGVNRGGVWLVEGGDVQGCVEALVGKCSDKGPPQWGVIGGRKIPPGVETEVE